MMTLKGDRALLDALQALEAKAPRVVGQALFESANEIMTDSKANYVPVDEGALRASGIVELPDVNGSNVSVEMGFGGPSAPYALIQHENPDFNHPVGEDKYLEKPLLKHADSIPGKVLRKLEAAAKR